MVEKTPHEAWTGSNPSVSHLRVFGSMCFRHVPEQLRKKLDDQSEVMVLIGYHSTGAYKLYSPIKDKLVINRYVLVDESKGWDWSRSSVRQESDIVTTVFEGDEKNEASIIQNEQVDTSTGRIEEPPIQLCSKEINKMELRQVKMNKLILRLVELKNCLCRRKEDPQEQELFD